MNSQAVTAGVLIGCSDVIAQKISGIKKIQLRRLILMMVCRFRSIYFPFLISHHPGSARL